MTLCIFWTQFKAVWVMQTTVLTWTSSSFYSKLMLVVDSRNSTVLYNPKKCKLWNGFRHPYIDTYFVSSICKQKKALIQSFKKIVIFFYFWTTTVIMGTLKQRVIQICFLDKRRKMRHFFIKRHSNTLLPFTSNFRWDTVLWN